MMEAKVIVEAKDLTMNYHTLDGETAAIKDLNLQVYEGEFVSIIGPSGCGKSTLLSLIAGLLTPSNGAVLVKGEVVSGPNPNVGYMPQRDQLFPWRNILNNVLIGLEVQHKLNDETREKAKELLSTYGLGDFIHHYPNQLSGGMRQRAALIRTLAINPEILLLDESFSALDYQTRLAVSDEVRSIIYKEKKTSILVTHDIAEAISMSDRIIVLTKRPATVKNIHEIRLSCDELSPIKRREAPEFRSYFNQIWKELDVK
ncbi:MAG: spermidine/putrescine transporter ATP-binding protein [Peptococcaceae bacterium]|jgi:NitT/TauT family transport system ATP-binding protein|nr:spermidine/putrescine transporter ATP-binding protein [Peptococcaceae bacterium]